MSPVSRLWFGKNIEPLGIIMVVFPAPGLLNVIVFPIPVSLSGSAWEVPIESLGLKYISISSLVGKRPSFSKSSILDKVLERLESNLNTLGIDSSIVDCVCEIPTNSTGLKTLILLDKSSTSKTLTISDETPTLNLSLVLILLKSPLTGRKVTMPVAVAVPIPWVRISFVDVIPISCGPIRSVAVDDRPPTFTITEFCKFKDVDAIPTNVSPNILKNLTPDIDSLDILISDIEPLSLIF